MTSNWLLWEKRSRIALVSSWIKQRKCNQVCAQGRLCTFSVTQSPHAGLVRHLMAFLNRLWWHLTTRCHSFACARQPNKPMVFEVSAIYSSSVKGLDLDFHWSCRSSAASSGRTLTFIPFLWTVSSDEATYSAAWGCPSSYITHTL